MTDRIKTCCDILELPEVPSLPELKSAYKKLIKQWHPDRFHSDARLERLAQQKAKKINEAYRYLVQVVGEGSSPTEAKEWQGVPNPYHTRHRYTWQRYTPGFPDPHVLEIFLDSSHIVSAGYDRERQILYLKFLGNEIFLYYDVPEYVYYDFMYAESHGRYALKYIYPRFRYKKYSPFEAA